MADPAGSAFDYVIYFRAAPETIWTALTDPEIIRRYWFEMTVACDWSAGSPWRLLFRDGRPADVGEVLEIEPLRRLVLRWRNVWNPEFAAEGDSRCTFELELVDGAAKLTIHHETDRSGSGLIDAVSGGWPRILSNLKTLIETKQPLFGA